MSTALLTTIIGGVVGVLGVAGTIVVQRMSGRITSVNSTVQSFQAAATEANARAAAAEERAAGFREEITRLWTQVGEMQGEMTRMRRENSSQQQQLDWSKAYAHRLTSHINDRKGPPPPPVPEGLHWPDQQGDTSS